MLLTKEVEVGLVSSVIKHYEDLGYKIPRRKDKYGILSVKSGTKIIVKVNDLPITSLVKVEVECDYCGESHPKVYGKYISGRKLIEKDACLNCSYLKQREVFNLKYGVNSPMQVDKFKKTIIEKTKAFSDIKDLQKEFTKKNCLLISTEYINFNQQLEFICLKHSDKGIQTCTYANFKQDKFCRYCGNDKIGDKLRLDYNFVKSKFEELDYELLSLEYKNANQILMYRCNLHPKHIQFVTYNNFFYQDVHCKYCSLEKRITKKDLPQSELFNFLRGKIIDWKKDSIKICNYKCVLSNGKFNDLHHLHPFHKIVYESLLSLGLPLHKYVDDYTKYEIIEIIRVCIEKHYEHGYGICLSREYHSLFHQIFGYSNTTKEDFEDFKQRYYNFEFDDLLEDEYKYKTLLLKEVG